MRKGVFLKCNLQYKTTIIWGAELPSQMSHLNLLCSVCGGQEVKLEPSGGGVTPISRHYVYVPPNRVFFCLFDPSFTSGKKVHVYFT